MIGLFNGSGSGKIIKVYRISALNNQTVSVPGVSSVLKINLISTGSGGLYLTPVKHSSSNPSIPSQIITSTNMSFTTSVLLRNCLWSNDEPLMGTAGSVDEFQTLPRFMNLWESSYKDTNVQPITVRPGQGVAVINSTNTSVGIADFFMEFTMENI